MGGGQSRFDDTDWEKADGKLLRSTETLDGFPPTKEYCIYHLQKRAVNQRDFDVTDNQSNLLYTTRCIEGTLAWFDVLWGPDMLMDDYRPLLRVQVDLSRRYWVVYRYGNPAYPGQFPDTDATTRLRASRGEEQPCLYKIACITVTWARMHAIVNFYGPPKQFEEENNKNEEKKEEHTEITTEENAATCMDKEATETKEQEIKEEPNEKHEIMPDNGADENKMTEEQICQDEEEKEKAAEEKTEGLTKEPETAPQERSNGKLALKSQLSKQQGDIISSLRMVDPFVIIPQQISDSQRKISVGLEDAVRVASVPRAEQWKKWLAKKAAATMDDLRPSPPDPLEGYLQLDQPVLKCEEILAVIGQHQTKLVSKEEAKKLKEEELEEAKKTGTDAYRPERTIRHPVVDGSPPKSQRQGPRTRIRKIASWVKTKSRSRLFSNTNNNNTTPSEEEVSFLNESGSPSPSASSNDQSYDTVDTFEHSSDDINQTNGDTTSENKSIAGETNTAATTPSSSSEGDDTPEEEENGEQPLVGFWAWENTMRVHKIKMHVAKGSDLALHVVLAVVTNQLRMERNVIVSSV